MSLFFEIKQILINYQVQMFVLGILMPLVFVAIVYHMRYMMRLGTFRMALMLSLSSIAFVPSLIAYFQFNPSLSTGSCIRHRAKFVTIKDKGEEFTTSLSYMIKAIDGERYELVGNDTNFSKIKFNQIDLDPGFEKLDSCPGRILEVAGVVE